MPTGHPAQFQSLVGTLKTRWQHSGPRLISGVSIPRRYAKNPEYQDQVSQRRSVSIPRRYAKNGSQNPFCADERMFQSLVGTLKTSHHVIMDELHASFNPS